MSALFDAQALDAADPLAHFRERFRLPANVIYLDGNSLGALPAATPPRLSEIAEQAWGDRLIRSWNEAGWIDAPRRIGDKIAQLLGAQAGEVIVADSTSVNLFKLIVAAVEIVPERRTILVEAANFPTDLHVARRATELLGRTLRVAHPGEIADLIDGDTALIVLPHVHYRDGARIDMAALNLAARRAGTRILWDLSHSVGAVPLSLGRDGAELAVGCGYKYLNGGPGAPSFLYVASELIPRLRSPIAGWLGHADPFSFGDDYAPAPGIERFQVGTPPILSMAALEAGVDLMLTADLDVVWEKSCKLFDLFADRVQACCPALMLASPRDPARRGSHISFKHPHAFAIVQALVADGVIGDFRAPDVLRFGLTPLTLRYADIWLAVETLAVIMTEERWRDPRFLVRGRVT